MTVYFLVNFCLVNIAKKSEWQKTSTVSRLCVSKTSHIFKNTFFLILALLADNLNAEISLGTVTNVEEAVEWLSYTYLYVRMRKNPLVYGMKYAELKVSFFQMSNSVL